MAIKFRCPECRNKIRVADEYAGRRGECPSCGQTVPIPPASTLPENGSLSEEPAAGEPRRGTAGPVTPVAVRAPGPESTASAAGGIPAGAALPAAESSRTAPAPAEAARPAGTGKTAAGFIKFRCPGCDRPIAFAIQLAGIAASCPKCQAKIMVPAEDGGEAFLIGALPEARPAPAAKLHGPRLLARRVVRITRSPRQALLVLLGCAAALALATYIIWQEFRTEWEGANEAPGPGAASTDAPAPAASLAAVPAVGAPSAGAPAAMASGGGRTPGLGAGAGGATPENGELGPMALVEIGARKDWRPAPVIDPVRDFALDRKPRPGSDNDDDGPSASRSPPAAATASGTAPSAKPDPQAKKEGAGDEQKALVPGLELPKAPENVEPLPVPQQPAPVDPPPVCPDCKGAGWLPLQPYTPFVRMGRDAAPDAQAAVPWRPCPKCQPTLDAKAAVAAAAERLAQGADRNSACEKQVGLTFEWGETRYVTVRSQLSAAATRNILAQLDKLTGRLQSDTKSALFALGRPHTHEILVLRDAASYNKVIDALAQQAPGGEWDLSRRATGVISRNRSFFSTERNGGVPPEHMALFQFAHMLMDEATHGKAPAWLKEGFSAYCENLILQKNLCYTFRYELNQVRFGPNWSAEIRAYAQQGKLKTWDQLFMLDLIGMKSLDYLTCYSVVAFLFKDPARFLRFTADIRDGVEAPRAMERAYERSVKDLQMMWGQWTLVGR